MTDETPKADSGSDQEHAPEQVMVEEDSTLVNASDEIIMLTVNGE
jgi:hypothetical protein